jgi:hypothetical protein
VVRRRPELTEGPTLAPRFTSTQNDVVVDRLRASRFRVGGETAATAVIDRLEFISDETLCALLRAAHAELDRRDPAGAAAEARHAAEVWALWQWATTQGIDERERT